MNRQAIKDPCLIGIVRHADGQVRGRSSSPSRNLPIYGHTLYVLYISTKTYLYMGILCMYCTYPHTSGCPTAKFP